MLTVVLLASVAIAVALDGRARSGPPPLHFATTSLAFRTALKSRWSEAHRRSLPRQLLTMARGDRTDRPPARPIRNPFANSDPLARHRAVTGINAHVRWYQRVSSLVGIVVLVAVTGVLVAVSAGIVFVAARIVLELLVG